MLKRISTSTGIQSEYFEIVDDTELIPVSTKEEMMQKGKDIMDALQ